MKKLDQMLDKLNEKQLSKIIDHLRKRRDDLQEQEKKLCIQETKESWSWMKGLSFRVSLAYDYGWIRYRFATEKQPQLPSGNIYLKENDSILLTNADKLTISCRVEAFPEFWRKALQNGATLTISDEEIVKVRNLADASHQILYLKNKLNAIQWKSETNK